MIKILNNKRNVAFTLIELLAVIVIFAVILFMAVPNMLKVRDNAEKNSFKISSKVVAKALDQEKLENRNFDPTAINIDTLKSVYNLSSNNYEDVYVTIVNDQVRIGIIGKNDWAGLTACGTYDNMQVLGEDDATCDIIPVTPSSCFAFNGATKTITGYDFDNCPVDIVMPNAIDGVNIENIAPGAFIEAYGQYCYDSDYNETEVALNYVHTESDGYVGCFFDSNDGYIASVKFPKYLKTIGYSAFTDNALTVVNFSSATSLETIGDVAFSNNELTSVDLSKSQNLTTIGNGAFEYNSISDMNLLGLTKLTKIADNAFYYNSLTSLTIPNGVATIGEESFCGNQIENLTLPSSVVTIESSAFGDNQIGSVDLSGLTNLETLGDSAFSNNQITSVDLSNSSKLTAIGDYAFYVNLITSIDLSNLSNLLTIGHSAFNNNEIVDVDLSNSSKLTTIGDYAFDNGYIETVNLSGLYGLTTIGESAFDDGVLTSIDLSDSTNLVTIEPYAFDDNQLTSLNLNGLTKLTTIGEYSFEYSSLTSVDFSDLTSLISIGNGAFSGNQIASVDLSNSTNLTTIGDNAFGENQITSVTIPNNVTYLSGFDYNQITSITIPNSVTSIGNSAFEENQLASVTIPSNVTYIGSSAFNSNQITSATIPTGVTDIERGAFSSNLLTSITIPSTVTYIGGAAFNNNLLLEDQAFIYARNSNGSIRTTELVSYGGTSRSNITVPSNVITIANYAFSNNQLTSITIPTSVTTIGTNAFISNLLTSVTIPNSVSSIGSYAFYKDSASNPNLTSITNKAGKSFNWGNIVNGPSGYNFIAGTISNGAGDVTISVAGQPTITILGNSSIDINVGDTYVDAGATATDSKDGNLTSQIQTVNNVNPSIAGAYYVTYTVTNSDGYTTIATRTVNVYAPLPSYVAATNKLPILGVGGTSSYPTEGWTSIQNSSSDDSYVNIPLPFSINMFGISYNSVYVGSNGYLTFGSGSTSYSSLSASVPPYDKIHFGSTDNSFQRVEYYSTANYVRIRYEGMASTSGTPGSSNIIVEFTLFNPTFTSGNTTIEMLVGNHSRTGGTAMIANSSGTISVPYTLTPSTSYVFAGDSTGNGFSVYKSYSVSGVDY